MTMTERDHIAAIEIEPAGTREEFVKALLKMAYVGLTGLGMNSRVHSATGLCLADRFVTALDMRHAVGTLPVRQQQVIRLSYGCGLTAEEVARMLARSRRTVAEDKYLAIQALIRELWIDPAYTSQRRYVPPGTVNC